MRPALVDRWPLFVLIEGRPVGGARAAWWHVGHYQRLAKRLIVAPSVHGRVRVLMLLYVCRGETGAARRRQVLLIISCGGGAVGPSRALRLVGCAERVMCLAARRTVIALCSVSRQCIAPTRKRRVSVSWKCVNGKCLWRVGFEPSPPQCEKVLAA